MAFWWLSVTSPDWNGVANAAARATAWLYAAGNSWGEPLGKFFSLFTDWKDRIATGEVDLTENELRHAAKKNTRVGEYYDPVRAFGKDPMAVDLDCIQSTDVREVIEEGQRRFTELGQSWFAMAGNRLRSSRSHRRNLDQIGAPASNRADPF